MNTTWDAIATVPWYGQSIVTTANLNLTLAIGSPPPIEFYLDYRHIYQSLDKGCSWHMVEDAGLPEGDDMVHLALSSTGQYAYLVTDSMSIYASSDYAQSWEYIYQPVREGSPDLSASSLITSPSGQYVAACGDWDVYTSGQYYFIVISTDYGAAWSLRDLPEFCWSIAADANFSTIWLSSWRDSFHPLWKSTDLGASWVELEGFGNIGDSKFSCSQSGQYVALVGGGTSYFSSDYGQNFSTSEVFGSSSDLYGAKAVVSDVTGRHLVALLDEVNLDRGIYVSHDFGETWQLNRDTSDTNTNSLASSSDGSIVLAGSAGKDGKYKEILAGRLQPMGSYCPKQEDPALPLYAIIVIAVGAGLIACFCFTGISLCLRGRWCSP